MKYVAVLEIKPVKSDRHLHQITKSNCIANPINAKLYFIYLTDIIY